MTRYVVWTYTDRSGPFYPKIVEALGTEGAVDKYISETYRGKVAQNADFETFIVAQVNEAFEVDRTREVRHRITVRHYEPVR